MPDIDIDFADRDVILSQLNHRVAKLDTEDDDCATGAAVLIVLAKTGLLIRLIARR